MFGRSAACGTASVPSPEAEKQDERVIGLDTTSFKSRNDMGSITFSYFIDEQAKGRKQSKGIRGP